MFANYSCVQLITDRFQDEGAQRGAVGHIIEVYGDAYEVEFSDSAGTTITQIVTKSDEIELCDRKA
jgi:hypothetical protein